MCIRDSIKKACVIGGGVGNAIAYPSAKALFNMGVDVDVIAGFRSKDIVILEDEYKEVCNRLFITTDDGTYGEKGFVTNKLQDLIDAGNNYDLVIAIGPIPMMKFVSKVTEPYNIKTLVSLNPVSYTHLNCLICYYDYVNRNLFPIFIIIYTAKIF